MFDMNIFLWAWVKLTICLSDTGFDLSGSQSDLHASIEALASPEKVNVADIDPEAVRHELRALMTQMNQVELERVSPVAGN